MLMAVDPAQTLVHHQYNLMLRGVELELLPMLHFLEVLEVLLDPGL
jgi:hypothetical protein